MKKVEVTKIDNYNYSLYDGRKEYLRHINFIDTTIEVGDYLYVSDDLLKYNTMYTFGPLTKDAEAKYSMKVIKKDKEIYLTRYFG